jgi:hypothetical protein
MTKHRLAILPGITYYDINVGPSLAQAAIPFLDATQSRIEVDELSVPAT